MDYDSLHQQGIRHLERMAGTPWTNFNASDPGITILEQLCYALTDLGYRIDYDMADLLASGGGDPYASLYPPAEILTTRAVTLADLRQLALDVPGVKNAWIEPLDEDEIALHYHPGRKELGLEAEPPASEPVRIGGLYRVLIETSDLDSVDGSIVRPAVARRLHENRNLCEDFAEIRVLATQKVRVHGTVEIAPVEDAGRLLVEIFAAIASQISPDVPFLGFEEMLARGISTDELFDGPRLDRGFVDDDTLAAATRRTVLNTSDIVHAIMDVEDVRAVHSVRLAVGDASDAWSLALDPESAPKLDLDLQGSDIRLERAGHTAAVDFEQVKAAYAEHRASMATRGGRRSDLLAPAAGRDRNVERYHSVQHHFPAAYGIGALGLPSSAPPERQARARQIEAYLLFFDQLLANAFAQLAHAGELFSFHGDDLRSYFAGRLEDPALRLEKIRGDGPDHQSAVEALVESDDGSGLERKNRFLSHLLARFAEQLTDYSLILPDAMPDGEVDAALKLARDKQDFLRDYPRLSGGRGTAFSYLEPPGPDNLSGLEERVRRKLGLLPEEETILIEHLLLRPMAEDDVQDVPLLAAVTSVDPFSHQLSFVFLATGRLEEPGEPEAEGDAARRRFRSFIEQTVRDETPAHLVPHVHWCNEEDWTTLRDAWLAWLERRRTVWTRKLGVTE